MRNRIVVALLVATASVAMIAQDRSFPTDDGYVSSHTPKGAMPAMTDRVEDDPAGRQEAVKEQFGGEFTPQFIASVVEAANQQRAQYGPAGRGAIKVPAGGVWTNIGPYRSNWIQNGLQVSESDTGRVRSFLVHPTNADIVYVLKSSGGLWKTTNFSQPRPNWRPMSDTIFSTSGGNVAFGRNPETLFLGTGDPFDPGVGGFMYRSANGGEEWSTGIKLQGATRIPDVKVDSTGDTDVVLVGTNAGLYRSTDSGGSYTRVLGHDPITLANGFVITYNAWSLQQTSAGWLVATTTNSTRSTVGTVLFSGDRGLTWTPVPLSGIGRTTLAAATSASAIVYAFAATTNNTAQKDLYRSIDGGLTWAALGLPAKTPINPNAEQRNMNIMRGQAFYNQMLFVDPNDATSNTVYIGGQLSSAKSTDGGNTWRVLTNWLAQFKLPYVHADHHAAAVASIKGVPILLFGGDGGLFTSDDGGATFSSQKNDGMSSYLIYAMTGNPRHRDDVLIGLQDNGTRWRVGPTGTYNQVFGGDGFGVAWSQADDLLSLSSIYYSFIIRNRRNPPNTQAKWEVGYNGIAEVFVPAQTYFNTAIAAPRASADPAGLTYLHRTRFKLYRTTNGAASWHTVLNTGALALRAGSHPIGISPDDIATFGVLGNGGNAWFTNDGGTTWRNKILNTATVPGWPGFNSTLAYADNDTMYMGNEAPVDLLNPPAPGTVPLRVIKSTDGGNTWTGAGAGLPNVPMTKIITSTRDASGRTLYVGTWLGVYETTDGGASWHLYGQGLPMVNVSDLYMPPDGSYLRVSTFGRGVWEIKL